MWYVINATDTPDSLERRLAVRASHLARLQLLVLEGRLLLAGPYPTVDNPDPGPAGYSGSLIIAEFDSLADAETWAKGDPYVDAGVYGNVSVKPFRRVLP